MVKRTGLTALTAAFALLPRLYAPPPLVTGDVPTADAGHFELYAGVRYQDTGRIQRQIPHVELVYGLTDRCEISAEGNYLSQAGARGLDDFTVAAKAVLAPETATAPAVGASYEFKFDNGDASRGLGSGGVEHDLRLRAQKTFGRYTPLANAGRVFVPDATIGGRRAPRRDAWRASVAQEWTTTNELKLLGEVYWRTADEPGEASRLGWNVGFKYRLHDGLAWHGAVGKSLRGGNRGGPDLRIYFGFKTEFTTLRRTMETREKGLP